MTAQPEYFLIEVNDLEILEEVLKDSMQRRILARTRTRPHTPAPALDATGGNDTILCCNNIHKDIADRAARTATLATLDKLCEMCPLLDERPDSCEGCVVGATRKKQQVGEQG